MCLALPSYPSLPPLPPLKVLTSAWHSLSVLPTLMASPCLMASKCPAKNLILLLLPRTRHGTTSHKVGSPKYRFWKSHVHVGYLLGLLLATPVKEWGRQDWGQRKGELCCSHSEGYNQSYKKLYSWDGLGKLTYTEARGLGLYTSTSMNQWIQAAPEKEVIILKQVAPFVWRQFLMRDSAMI